MNKGSKSQNKGKSYVYFYLNRNGLEKNPEAVSKHIQYWQNAAVSDFIGGPFSDHTGGLIFFRVSNMEEAINITRRDPFFINDLITQRWIKVWDAE